MHTLIWSTTFWFLWVGAPTQDSAKLYRDGVKQFEAGQLKAAESSFKQLVSALEAEKKKVRGQQVHLRSIGQADAYSYLGAIAWKNNLKRQSCIYYSSLTGKIKALPKAWTTWEVNPLVRARLKKGLTHSSTECIKVPSLISFKLEPKETKVSHFVSGKWQDVKVKSIQILDSKKHKFKFERKGYFPKEQSFQVERWKTKSFAITLKKVPPKKVIKRPRPKKPVVVATPIYKKWYFWTIIGAVAVGGATAGVLAYTNRTYIEGLRDGPDSPGYTLWKN